jgi:hypothetical protein
VTQFFVYIKEHNMNIHDILKKRRGAFNIALILLAFLFAGVVAACSKNNDNGVSAYENTNSLTINENISDIYESDPSRPYDIITSTETDGNTSPLWLPLSGARAIAVRCLSGPPRPPTSLRPRALLMLQI